MLTSYEVARHEFAGAKVLIILRILTLLENIITYFHFRVYQIFVSSLFLVLVYSNKLYCVSITYEELTGFQEEYHDGGWRLYLPASPQVPHQVLTRPFILK